MCISPAPPIWSYAELRRARSRRQIERAVRSGHLIRVRRGVYAASDVCEAAASAAAHGGSLGCVSAARHIGLWVLADDVAPHVWLQGHGHRHHPAGCGCVSHWDDGAAAGVFGLPSVPRILLQIYACRGEEAFFTTLESARAQGVIDTAGIAWLRQQMDRAGQCLVDFSRSDAGSGLESLVRLRLRHHGMTVRTQARLTGTGDVDLLIDDWLVIETDGRDNHDGPSMRHKDLRRDANTALWGRITLRFDYALVIHDWDLVERAILTTYSTYGPRRRS